MTYTFPNNFQQRGERVNGYPPNYPPRSYHRDPPSPTDMPQGASSGGSGGTRQIKNDPDTEQNLEGFSSDIGGNVSGPAFAFPHGRHQMYQNFPQYHGGHQYGQELKMDDMAQALEDPQNLMIEHPSPGSDGYPSWDDQDILSSADNNPLHFEPPQSHEPLPSHQETESYLRQNLSIFPPKPVNLTALPDEPFGSRLPKIAELIKLAIWGSPNKRLTLRQIYDAIETRYPTWKAASDKPWQRSIRHNLSLKAIFVRVERPVNHPGKGCYWALDVRQGEGNKRDRRRKDAAGNSRSSASEDSDEDDRNPSRVQSGSYMPPQNVFQPSGPTDAMATHAGYMFPPPIHHYSEQAQMMGANPRWPPSISAPHLQHYNHPTMMPSGMQVSRANTYPPMGLPPQVEHYAPMRGGGPNIAGHGYSFPPMPARQANPHVHNAPLPRARRPHSDTFPEEDAEEIARSSRRHRTH